MSGEDTDKKDDLEGIELEEHVEDSAFEEEEEEIALGGTPAGAATNEALRALARAARSFLIYDPRNEAIRGFLQSYRDLMYKAVKEFDEMPLIIRPFEMVREGEVVYLQRDREKSLAFRLFRDGVRKLTIETEVTWEELLRLLEILSIRFTGIRQQEDDIVTLLLKSGFKNIQIAAVEGFVPDDEEYCGDDPDAAAAREIRAKRRETSHIEVPNDWDLPLPSLQAPIELNHLDVPEGILESLTEEASSVALANNVVSLVVHMLHLVADPIDPTQASDVEGLLGESRDFLLSEGQLAPLLQLVQSVRELLADNEEQASEVLGSFADQRAIRRIVNSVPKGQSEAPQELLDLLDAIPADHLTNLVSLLETERSATARGVLRSLIARYATEKLEFGLKRIAVVDAAVAADLFEALVNARPERAIDIIKAVSKRKEADIQFRMLTVMEEQELPLEELVSTLYVLYSSELEAVRIRTLKLLTGVRDVRLFKTLLEQLESKNLPLKEAEAIGEALATINPKGAQRALQEWIKPKGLFSFKRVSVKKSQQWAAVSALGILPEKDNVKLIRKLRDAAGEEMAHHCSKVLYKRRRLGL